MSEKTGYREATPCTNCLIIMEKFEDIFERARKFEVKKKFKYLIEECKKDGRYAHEFKGRVYCSLCVPGWCEDMVPFDGGHGYDFYCGRRNGDKC